MNYTNNDLTQKIDELAYSFQCNPSYLPKEKYLKWLSSKAKNKIFPPYIPFIGKDYIENLILVYCTAQNLKEGDSTVQSYENHFSKLSRRLNYSYNFVYEYPESNFQYKDIDIAPYQQGVIPSLISLYFFIKHKQQIKNLSNINDKIAISNYFKFSLNTNKRDINPILLPKNFNSDLSDYFQLNDELVRKELEVLKPNYIFAIGNALFNHLKTNIKDNSIEIIKVNDPSWILRGGSGCLKPEGSWYNIVHEENFKDLKELLDGFQDQIIGNYGKRRDEVFIYLKKYALDWKVRYNK